MIRNVVHFVLSLPPLFFFPSGSGPPGVVRSQGIQKQ